MKQDEYKEVLNSAETYQEIVTNLHERGSCLIGWTDEMGTHFDILFVWKPPTTGNIQGWIRPLSDLFVSILRIGSFGFETGTGTQAHAGYYAEKLNLDQSGTLAPLKILIDAVRQNI